MTARGNTEPARKPLHWVGSSKKSLGRLPGPVKDVIGTALLDVQFGDVPVGARPFGEGLPHGIWKITEDFDRNTYRVAYAGFAAAVYVLDVFIKKSKSGISTPQADKIRIRERFKAAINHYDATYRTNSK